MPPESYIIIAALLVILILLFRINGRLAALSSYLSRQSRAAKPEPADAVEIGPATHFEEFLKEDPELSVVESEREILIRRR